MHKAKDKIPKKYIIGDTCFTSLGTIGGNLFTRHLKNINHVNKYSINFLSVIIIWEQISTVAKKLVMMKRIYMTM